jgi:DNA-directed RNA polymerase subunit RPC12/RpoP
MEDCKCEDCGKEFKRGDEGDNERFCLRCEYLALRRGRDELDAEYLDYMSEGE